MISILAGEQGEVVAREGLHGEIPQVSEYFNDQECYTATSTAGCGQKIDRVWEGGGWWLKVSRLLVNVHHFSCARRLLSEMNDINLLFYINNRRHQDIHTFSRTGRDASCRLAKIAESNVPSKCKGSSSKNTQKQWWWSSCAKLLYPYN